MGTTRGSAAAKTRGTRTTNPFRGATVATTTKKPTKKTPAKGKAPAKGKTTTKAKATAKAD